MKKSKKVLWTIISLLALLAVTAFLVLHLCFPIKYNDKISSASQKYNVDAGFIRAIIWVESKYKKDAQSSKGAVGLMQLLPSTAEFIAQLAGYQAFEPSMLWDEGTNIDLGVFYFRYLLDKFDDPKTALAAYNAGEGRVQKWQDEGQTTIPYKETRDYIKRVSMVKGVYDFKAR